MHVGRQVGQQMLSVFSVFTSTVYITTFWVMVALRRTLPTEPLNSLPGNASHVKVTGAPGTNVPDVGLVDRDPDLHPGQILGDEEQAGRVEAGNHRLADVHAPINDDAPDRRFDRAETQVAFCFLHGGLRLHRACLGLGDVGFSHGNVGLADFISRLGGFIFG